MTTSADITEMLAYSNLEPWGPLADDFRAGQICATLVNIHRDAKSRHGLAKASDFMPGLQRATTRTKADEPILLDDPEAQSALIKSACFGLH